MTETLAVHAQSISKRYGRNVALRGVDLEVRPGERVAVFGPNGSGKTTLLRILAGLTRQTKGRFWLHGLDLSQNRQSVRRRLGVVAHHPYLYDDLSAEENLQFYGRMFGLEGIPARVEQALRAVGMEHRRRDRVRTLSRGMQQRVAIARALLHDPDLLLMDEPDTGLDQDAANRLSEWLDRERGQRRTVLMATHDLRLGLRSCERFVILSAGRVVHRGDCTNQDLAGFEELYARHVAATA